MEITRIHYRNAADRPQEYTGPILFRPLGVVLIFSENSQYFVPSHKIDGIEQTFSPSVPANEKYNKSLAARMAAAK